MKSREAATGAQTISAEEAAALVTSGMWLDYGTGVGQPDVFDRALAARIRELTNVKIRHCLTMRPRAVHQADPEGRHVHSVSLHFSGCDRKSTTRAAAATCRSISARSRTTTGVSSRRSTSSSSRPARSTRAGTST